MFSQLNSKPLNHIIRLKLVYYKEENMINSQTESQKALGHILYKITTDANLRVEILRDCKKNISKITPELSPKKLAQLIKTIEQLSETKHEDSFLPMPLGAWL